MKEHGILFKPEMIKAIEDDRKTMTRRRGGLEEINERPNDFIYSGENAFTGTDRYGHIFVDTAGIQTGHDVQEMTYLIKPKYQPGDLLYVKEGFRISNDCPEQKAVRCVYRRDGVESPWIELTDAEWDKYIKWKNKRKWQSPLFMFKSLARLWMEVLEDKVEQVQEISKEDALAEGIQKFLYGEKNISVGYWTERLALGCMSSSAKCAFERLWISINGQESWDNNDWVFVYKFRRIER
jgi:hypothetical protein